MGKSLQQMLEFSTIADVGLEGRTGLKRSANGLCVSANGHNIL